MHAPAHWHRLEFLSDVHLHPEEAATAQAWTQALQSSTADALFILGDLFEVWIGDDDDSPFLSACRQTLQDTARARAVYFLCGNRDFLVGHDFLQRTGVQALSDPTVLDLGVCRLLLSHGDALCLDDTEYLAFRTEVRSAAWQQAFLAKPLEERRTIARKLRTESEARKQTHTMPYSDVDAALARQWLSDAQAHVLIHGHTHQPAVHTLNAQTSPALQRWVLSDWEADAQPPRLERTVWQRQDLHNGHCGLSREPLSLAS